MFLILISLLIGIFVIYNLFYLTNESVKEEIVTRAPCASCQPDKKEVKGCVSGMCSKKFGCGAK